MTLEHIKENYLLVLIKLLIVGLFLISLVSGISNLIDHFNFFSNYTANRLTEYFHIAINHTYLIPAATLLIPLIGVFINKKIGWIFIQSFFYFVLSSLIFSLGPTDFNVNPTILLLNLIGFLFLFLVILLMNKKKISHQFYSIDKTELLSKNIISSVIGILITIILALLEASKI